MFKYPNKKQGKLILGLIFFTAILLVATSLLLEYYAELEPCPLCVFERYIYLAIAATTALWRSRPTSKTFGILAILTTISLFSLSFYHVLLERKIIVDYTFCGSKNINEIHDINSLKEYLNKAKQPDCAEPEFFMLKLSLAEWNIIIALVFLVLLVRQSWQK